MAEWKEALRLASFELKASKLGIIYAFLWTLMIWNSLDRSLMESINEHVIWADVSFILFFSLVGYIARGGFYQKPINDRLMASHQLVLLKTLPANRSLIAKRHIGLTFIRSVIFQILFCLLLYWSIPELREWLNPLSYTAFSCMWIAFGLFTGGFLTAFDIVPRIDKPLHFIVLALLFLFLFMPILNIALTMIFSFTGYVLIYWIITAAQQAPILIIITSLVIILLSLYIWTKVLIGNIQDRDLY